MNQSADCHEVEGCPGLYVDAFRGHYLTKTSDSQFTFILTHYHGDHYGSLPREGKYSGPALIHCTPVTASLLISVHEVPAMYVVEHEYGQTFSCRIKNPRRRPQQQDHQQQDQQDQYDSELSSSSSSWAKITFYDANHCPGACMVFIQLPNGQCHLHTGDMRYHEKMKSYPLLQEAVLHRTLDLVYLDTTYGHPKHDFVPQQEAIEAIASQTEQLLVVFATNDQHHHQHQSTTTTTNAIIRTGSPDKQSKEVIQAPTTLVLLSCYSIGKERVVWESSTRANQLVYVSEKKLRMLHCIKGRRQRGGGGGGDEDDVSSQIITRCTRDPSQSDIHVIPMGMAGELWPFFRPNFQKCVDYVQALDKRYDRVVAFIPTGWALSSNWNKKHAISQKRVEYEKGKREKHWIDVEIRLVSYSEHSTFTELMTFVQYLRPRKVIPTVYSNDGDRRKIEERFRNLLDSTRAKEAFFRTMMTASSPDKRIMSTIVSDKSQTNNKRSKIINTSPTATSLPLSIKSEPGNDECQKPVANQSTTLKSFDGGSDDEIEVLYVKNPESPTSQKAISIDYLKKLVAMGFDRMAAENALLHCENKLEETIEYMLQRTGKSSCPSS